MRKTVLFFVILLISCTLSAKWMNFVSFSPLNKEIYYNSSVYISSGNGLGKYNLNSNIFSILTTANGISSNNIIDMSVNSSCLYLLHDSSITVINQDSTYTLPFTRTNDDNPNHISLINNKIYISADNGIITGDFNGIIYQFTSHASPFGNFKKIINKNDTTIIASDSGLIFACNDAIWDSTTWIKHLKDALYSPHVNDLLLKGDTLFIATEKGMNRCYNNIIDSIPNTGLSDSTITTCSLVKNRVYAVIGRHVYYLENNGWKFYSPLENYFIDHISGNDSILIVSDSEKIFKIKGNTSVVKDITPTTLLSGDVAAITSDRGGNAYILYGFNSKKMDIIQDSSVTHYSFTSNLNTAGGYAIACDMQNKVWIGFWDPGTSPDIICMDTTGEEHLYSFPSNTGTVSDIKFDRKNRLWLLNYSNYSNLFMLNGDSDWVKYNNNYTGWMYRIYIDRQNNVWLGSYHIGKASCLDTNGIWHEFSLNGAATVSGFAQMDDTTMYISTENGIYVIRNLSNITHISELGTMDLDNIVDMTVDPYNNLWIAKPSEGIYVRHNGNWLHFTSNDGLVSANFGSVGGGIKKPQKLFAFDKKDNCMYIGSLDGVSRFYDDSLFIFPINNTKIDIYPNPAKRDKIYVNFIPPGVSISVYSLSGKYMGKFDNTDSKTQLSFDTSNLIPGIYYAVATKSGKRLSITKFAVTNR